MECRGTLHPSRPYGQICVYPLCAENDRDIFLFNNNIEQQTSNSKIEEIEKIMADDSRIVELRRSVRKVAESQLENGVIDATSLLDKITAESQASLSLQAYHGIQRIQYISVEIYTLINEILCMKSSLVIKFLPCAAAVIMVGCSENNDYDATGIFEATTVTVSAETSGRILSFPVEEGDSVYAGQQVAQIDSTHAHAPAGTARKPAAVCHQQQSGHCSPGCGQSRLRSLMPKKEKRVERLFASGAATPETIR